MTDSDGGQNAMDVPEHNYYKVVLGHREEFFRRTALQAAYNHWASRMKRYLSNLPGESIELGCGCGALSNYLDLVKTDIYKHPWVDRVADACQMPFVDGECANLVAVDMVHHLPEPSRFLDEAARVLKDGGRLILLEPYISFFSYFFYRFLHHEPIDTKVSPFDTVTLTDNESGEVCNEAIPTLLFARHRQEFLRRWPMFSEVRLELSDAVVYPLTGGFSRRSLIPSSWVKPLLKIEDRIIGSIGRIFAMRMLIVLEKKST